MGKSYQATNAHDLYELCVARTGWFSTASYGCSCIVLHCIVSIHLYSASCSVVHRNPITHGKPVIDLFSLSTRFWIPLSYLFLHYKRLLKWHNEGNWTQGSMVIRPFLDYNYIAQQDYNYIAQLQDRCSMVHSCTTYTINYIV